MFAVLGAAFVMSQFFRALNGVLAKAANSFRGELASSRAAVGRCLVGWHH